MRAFWYSITMVFAGCTSTAAGNEEERLASIIRQNECQVTKTEAEVVLGSRGFSPEQVRKITDRWKANVLMTTSPEPEREVLYLGPELCQEN
jgi:hypothetical protein